MLKRDQFKRPKPWRFDDEAHSITAQEAAETAGTVSVDAITN